jgi:hypothetical protein
MDETLTTALEATSILDRLGIRWFLGGSLASSLLGVPRATLNADIVADIEPDHVATLLRNLGDVWYADESAIREAIERRSSFNLIHYATAIKLDVFIPKRRKFEAGEFARARRIPVAADSDIQIPVCSIEDIVLAKLEWFRLGGEHSERQWSDILGVLRVNATTLDRCYLREGATDLMVTDLLERALESILPAN